MVKFIKIQFYLLTILFILIAVRCHSMKVIETRGDYYRSYEVKVKKNEYLHFETDFPFTGFSIKFPKEQDYHKAFIVLEDHDTIYLQTDPHYESKFPKEFSKSVMIIREETKNNFILFTSEINGKISIHLVNAKSGSEIQPFQENNESDFLFYKSAFDSCTKPQSVSQEIWRAGLPEPTANPQSHKVNHVIVHHSAGSNFNTNYQNTVRNIYLDHTQVNGWDDIGYNYIIAGDGTLFDGRDGQGLLEDDNVRGAHFCMKNTGTMGICILGTYMDTLPSDTAFSVLFRLMSWKLNKEAINTTDSFLHPANDPDAYYLKSISGHLDGCATLCPGNELYLQLDTVRLIVQSILDQCEPFVQLSGQIQSPFKELVIYPNPANLFLNINFSNSHENNFYNISIFSLTGQKVFNKIFTENIKPDYLNIDVSSLNRGVYQIVIVSSLKIFNRLLILE